MTSLVDLRKQMSQSLFECAIHSPVGSSLHPLKTPSVLRNRGARETNGASIPQRLWSLFVILCLTSLKKIARAAYFIGRLRLHLKNFNKARHLFSWHSCCILLLHSQNSPRGKQKTKIKRDFSRLT